MLITLKAAKTYLRVDTADEDTFIRNLMYSAEQMVKDVGRMSDEELKAAGPVAKTAELYAVAYLYEHREEADHKDLVETLKHLLFSVRKEAF